MPLAETHSAVAISIPTASGHAIAGTCHHTPRPSGGAVLICPAMGVTARFYEAFARYLCEEGFDVVRFDYSGMGNSRVGPLRDNPTTMQSWAENDLAAALSWTRESLQPGCIAIVGHSAGGQLAGIAKSDVPVDAMLLVASQSGYWRHWAGMRRLSLLILWYLLMPLLSLSAGRFPARALRLGEDLPKNVARQWAHWGRSPDYMASDSELAERFTQYTGPILAYSFNDDSFAPENAVRALLTLYTNASIEHRAMDVEKASLGRIGHFGFFKESKSRDPLWHDTVAWLRSRMA